MDDLTTGGEFAVVGDRQRHRVRVREGAAGLRRAADHPTVAVLLVVADQRRAERALVFLDPDE